MLILLVGPKKAAFTLDAHRRVIEDYGQQTYDRTTYYEKWIRALRNLIVEQGIASREEVDAPGRRARALRQGGPQGQPRSASRGDAAAGQIRGDRPGNRFAPGQTVRVAERPAIGHCRTPWYLRGKTGVVASVQGTFRDPEKLAYHKPGLPRRVLYKVRFEQAASGTTTAGRQGTTWKPISMSIGLSQGVGK
jgi:nitrile hydratase